MESLEQEVNHPNHYTSHESGIETIQITRWLPCDLGNAWKYCTRYEDKGTPKKDLMKLVWYMNDYEANFINESYDVINPFSVPEKILNLMETVIEYEPVIPVKEMFKVLLKIVKEQKIANVAEYNSAIDGIKQLSENFSK